MKHYHKTNNIYPRQKTNYTSESLTFTILCDIIHISCQETDNDTATLPQQKCSETLPKTMENSMWYEIVHRVNWYTTDRYTVWLKTKDDVWPLLDHLEINECLMHEYNGEQHGT